MTLRIGISGSPESTPRSGSHHAVARCRELGIGALEMAWVHKVTLSEAGGARVRKACAAHDVVVSVHAPYYINLNSPDAEKRAASIGRIVAAGQAAAWAGARDVVLHLAWYHGDAPAAVLDRVADGLAEASGRLVDLGVAVGRDVVLRPEVMGRKSQFGDLDEVLSLCQRVPGTAPCVDIAHLHARTGAWNSPRAFDELWTSVVDALGAEALGDAHIHISGIAYGPDGERKHLSFAEADLDYRGFLEVLRDRGVGGRVIVESPAREADVGVLMGVWGAMGGVMPAPPV